MIFPGFDFVTLLLLLSTILVSALAWRNPWLFHRLSFEVASIRTHRQRGRLFTSGFIHLDLWHLLFNMLTLWSFGPVLYMGLGPLHYGVLYAGSLLAGSLLSLFIHRGQPTYSAVGASGAISGVIMGATVLHPHMGLSLFFIPLPIPAWIFAVIFTALSILGMKIGLGNIGHDAHLGGAFLGALYALAVSPGVFQAHILYILPMLALCLGFFVILLRNPDQFST